MVIREVKEWELQELLSLYLFLHEKALPEDMEPLSSAWEQIMADPNHHIIVAEEEGKLVSSCVCGLAAACLDYAKSMAEAAGCYKMMLLTGAKDEGTLEFYKKAGYNCKDKTAFIQWL